MAAKAILLCIMSSVLFVRVDALKVAAKVSVPFAQHWKLLKKIQAQAPLTEDGAWGRQPGDSDQEFRFRVLIATMLSPMTREKQNNMAINNLVAMVKPQPFVPSSLRAFSTEEIEKVTKFIPLYKTKARSIKQAAVICDELFSDDIPCKLEDLLKLRGVGPKIAHITFTVAWGETHGIVVDTHVHRISNRLGWVDTWGAKSNAPEKTRMQLQELLTRDQWPHVDRLLVRFGQSICEAKKPKCSECVLSSTCKYFNDPTYMR